MQYFVIQIHEISDYLTFVMNYRVNYLLLEQLPSLYPDGVNSFFHESNISNNTWRSWRENKQYRIMRIIEMCNRMLIPFEHFISEDERTDIIPAINDIFLCEKGFSNVQLNLKSLNRAMVEKKKKSSVIKKIGISRSTLHAWLSNQNSEMTMEGFVQICNDLNVPFTDFIHAQDDNVMSTTVIDRLKANNKKLTIQVKKLTEENEQLRKEKSRILDLFEKAVASRPMVAADDGISNYNA